MADEGGKPQLRIIDTNVLATANRHHAGAPASCIAECAVKLQQIMERGHVVLDDDWRILNQYVRNIHGMGPGEAFLQWLYQHTADPSRCTQVSITPKLDDLTDFDEVPAPLDLPEGEHIDPNDRMFLAVAGAHPDHPAILQATDSKWIGWETALQHHGIKIEWVCRDYAESTYSDKMPHRAPARRRPTRKGPARRKVRK